VSVQALLDYGRLDKLWRPGSPCYQTIPAWITLTRCHLIVHRYKISCQGQQNPNSAQNTQARPDLQDTESFHKLPTDADQLPNLYGDISVKIYQGFSVIILASPTAMSSSNRSQAWTGTL